MKENYIETIFWWDENGLFIIIQLIKFNVLKFIFFIQLKWLKHCASFFFLKKNNQHYLKSTRHPFIPVTVIGSNQSSDELERAWDRDRASSYLQ